MSYTSTVSVPWDTSNPHIISSPLSLAPFPPSNKCDSVLKNGKRKGQLCSAKNSSGTKCKRHCSEHIQPNTTITNEVNKTK